MTAMALTVLYSVYDRGSGRLLVKGTARECAAFFDICPETFKNRACDITSQRRWDVEMSEPMSSEKAAAIKSWDTFCAPLRKKYGIKVRKEKKEE